MRPHTAGIAGTILVTLALLLGALVVTMGAPGLDTQVIRAAAEHSSDQPLRDVAIAATDIGYLPILGPMAAIAAFLVAFARRNWRGAVAIGCTTFIAAVLNRLAKEAFDRARPIRGVRGLEDLDQVDITRHLAHGLSMPSGHSCTSAAFAMSFVLATPAGRPRQVMALVMGLFALMVGASRVVLRAHWPTDVLAGWMFGAGIALLVSWAVHRSADRWPRRSTAAR